MAYATNISGFKLGCHMILFLDSCQLSGSYKETMLVTYAFDADNHFFNFAYTIVSSKSVEDWVWFLQSVAECLGRFEARNYVRLGQALLKAILLVFGKANHNYCLCHLARTSCRCQGSMASERKQPKNL